MKYPPLPPGDQPPAPLAPTVNPASQSFVAPMAAPTRSSPGGLVFSNGEAQRRDLRPPDAPSRGVTVTPSSAPLVNSNGDPQRPVGNLNLAASSGVTVTPSSAPLVSSNGEQQRLEKNLHQAASSGVHSTPSSAPVSRSGDDWQRLNLGKPEEAVSTGTGLPTNVFADSKSEVKAMAPNIAEVTSPVVNVAANTTSKTGLPVNVNIR